MAVSIVNPELIDLLGGNALTVYCRYIKSPGLFAVILHLLQKSRINANVCDKDGRNALLAFLENKHYIKNYPKLSSLIVRTLINSKVSVQLIDNLGENAIWKLFNATADLKAIFTMAMPLLNQGIDINYEHPIAKVNAAIYLLQKRFQYLSLEEADDLDEEAHYLHKLIELFLYRGLDLSRSKTFLSFLLRDRTKHHPSFIETVQLLLRCGADINYNGLGGSPLHNCCSSNITKNSNVVNLIEFLIDNGANVNATDQKTGRNALNSFLYSNNSFCEDALRVISLLCERGCNVNQTFLLNLRNENLKNLSFDALRFICISPDRFSPKDILSIARILIKHGAIVKPHMSQRYDALFIMMLGYVCLVKLIIPLLPHMTSTSEILLTAHESNEDVGDMEIVAVETDETSIKRKVKASLRRWLYDNARLLNAYKHFQSLGDEGGNDCINDYCFRYTSARNDTCASKVINIGFDSNQVGQDQNLKHGYKRCLAELEAGLSVQNIICEKDVMGSPAKNIFFRESFARETCEESRKDEDIEEMIGIETEEDDESETDETENETEEDDDSHSDEYAARKSSLLSRKNGWHELIKYFLEQGGNDNIQNLTPLSATLLNFLLNYQGDDFIDILKLFCAYDVDVNSEKHYNNETLGALDMLMKNEHQHNNRHEAAMLLINQGLRCTVSGAIEYRRMFVNRMPKGKRSVNVIHIILNKCYGSD